MDFTATLPTLIASLNIVSFVLLVWAWRAIRAGRRDRHKTLMLVNLGVAGLFLAFYVTQLVLVGHKRFPGDDWVRSAFLVLLGTHTVAATSLLPLVPITLYRAFKEQFEKHRRIARVTITIWIYVSITGVMVYWMVNHLRPAV
jgi:putative membrane protein